MKLGWWCRIRWEFPKIPKQFLCRALWTTTSGNTNVLLILKNTLLNYKRSKKPSGHKFLYKVNNVTGWSYFIDVQSYFMDVQYKRSYQKIIPNVHVIFCNGIIFTDYLYEIQKYIKIRATFTMEALYVLLPPDQKNWCGIIKWLTQVTISTF